LTWVGGLLTLLLLVVGASLDVRLPDTDSLGGPVTPDEIVDHVTSNGARLEVSTYLAAMALVTFLMLIIGLDRVLRSTDERAVLAPYVRVGVVIASALTLIGTVVQVGAYLLLRTDPDAAAVQSIVEAHAASHDAVITTVLSTLVLVGLAILATRAAPRRFGAFSLSLAVALVMGVTGQPVDRQALGLAALVVVWGLLIFLDAQAPRQQRMYYSPGPHGLSALPIRTCTR